MRIDALSQKVYFSQTDIDELSEIGAIVDGRGGGLLIGNGHDAGGIKVIGKSAPGIYELMAEFEGWEYLLNADATEAHVLELEKINVEHDGRSTSFAGYDIPESVRTIRMPRADDFELIAYPFLLLDSGPNFVINKVSTSKHLERLDELNRFKK